MKNKPFIEKFQDIIRKKGIKFLHISDSHLGFMHSSYNIDQKTNMNIKTKDLFKRFKYCIKEAIEYEIDFIIHTGDLFHTTRPGFQIIIQTMEILRELEKYNIPFIVIAGNHEKITSAGSASPIELLKYLTNVYPITRYKSLDFNIKEKIVRIFGIAYQAIEPEKKIIELYTEMNSSNKQKADYRILMLHQTFVGGTRGNEFYTEDEPVDEKNLPNDLDYIAGGHIHSPQVISHPLNEELPIAYAGSTDRITFNERKEKKTGWACSLSNEGCKISLMTIPTREMIEKVLDLKNPSLVELETQIEKTIKEIQESDTFIGLRFIGEISQSLVTHLSLNKLKQKFNKREGMNVYLDKLVILGQEGERLTFGSNWINNDEEELKSALDDRKGLSEKEIDKLMELGQEIIEIYRED